jgi:hypothetical protein
MQMTAPDGTMGIWLRVAMDVWVIVALWAAAATWMRRETWIGALRTRFGKV